MPLEKLGFGIKLSTLESGLNVITKEFPGNLARVALAVRDGSVYDLPGYSGMAHKIEHCLFDGARTEAVSDQLPVTSDHKINWVVEGRGANLNGFNAYQSVSYVLDLNKKDLPLLLDLLLRIVLLPKLTRRSVQYQGQVISAELSRNKENPLYGDQHSTFFDELWREFLFPNNPIRNREGGRKEDVLRINQKLAQEHFAQFYAANNMALIVLGPFRHQEVVSLVKKFEKTFSSLLPAPIKNLPRVNPDLLKEKKLEKTIKIWENDHFEHLVINMGYRAPMVFERDHVPIRILHGILGAFTFGRIYKYFREKLGRSYLAESRYFRTSIHGELVMHVDFCLSKDNKSVINQAQEWMCGQLKQIAAGEVPKNEFEHVKTALYNHDRGFQLEDPDYVRNLLISAIEADDFNGAVSISKTIRNELESALQVKNCSFKRFVTAINRQIDPERYALLVSGPPGCYS